MTKTRGSFLTVVALLTAAAIAQAQEPAPVQTPEPVVQAPPSLPELTAQTVVSDEYFGFLEDEAALRFGQNAEAPLQTLLQDVHFLTVVRYKNGAHHVLFSERQATPDTSGREFTVQGRAVLYGLSRPSDDKRPVRRVSDKREWYYADARSLTLASENGDTLTFGAPYLGTDAAVAQVKVWQTGTAAANTFLAGVHGALARPAHEPRIVVAYREVPHLGTLLYPNGKPRVLKNFSWQFSWPQPYVSNGQWSWQFVGGGVSLFRMGPLRLPVISAGLGMVPRDPGQEPKEALLVSASGILRIANFDFGRYEMGLQFGVTRDVFNKRTGRTFGLTLGF